MPGIDPWSMPSIFPAGVCARASPDAAQRRAAPATSPGQCFLDVVVLIFPSYSTTTARNMPASMWNSKWQ